MAYRISFFYKPTRGTLRAKPAQGRAPIKPIVLR
jgi:hypothetical protein